MKRVNFIFKKFILGLPWWLSGKEFTCQCKRHWLNPWSGKIPQASGAAKLMCQNYGACAPDLRNHNSWAYMPQLLKPTYTRTHAPQERSHKLWNVQAMNSPRSVQLEKKPMQQQRPSRAKNNKQMNDNRFILDSIPRAMNKQRKRYQLVYRVIKHKDLWYRQQQRSNTIFIRRKWFSFSFLLNNCFFYHLLKLVFIVLVETY